ncbi:DNA-binding response regulator [Flavipsychrobacter stenotrophus]|uniref:DNA-binding response regulator n=1 Tax=Flavipsychrobacter stenotrophus TaxID=2077091 RepID=A0A2S7SSG8_9BACT|nr:response regulator transcription factor [Flavipsychrobacter stenotrophus]PQJ09869.1 DNA-binding response regulator [Flavipsychrobacter stenotrophus]
MTEKTSENIGRVIKIAIADDHPLVIDGLHHILTPATGIEIAGSYANGRELLHGLTYIQPDVLLLDIQMPGQTGDEVIDQILIQYPSIKILALTNQDNVYYIKTMLRKGANGYILKTTRKEILLDAIRTVYAGEHYIEPLLKDKLIRDTLQAKKQISADPILSRREKEVMQYIAADLTSQEIADKLFVSKRTVDNHRLSLMMKLGVKNAAALVKVAIQLGLID